MGKTRSTKREAGLHSNISSSQASQQCRILDAEILGYGSHEHSVSLTCPKNLTNRRLNTAVIVSLFPLPDR